MNDSEKKLLKDVFGNRAFFDVSARELTTFKTGGNLSVVVFPVCKKEIEFLFSLEKKGIPVKFIGCGSNILISDYGFDGVVAVTKKLNGINILENFISVNSGTKISSLIGFCIKNSLTGVEFLSGIPGTIGGAIINNAGTKEKSISQIIDSIEYLDKTGLWQNEKKEKINWGYRYSQLKEKAFFIFSTVLKIEKGKREKIKDNVSSIMKKRIKTQPLEYPSAGSVFKNPEGFYAGKLIEEAGLKGLKEGDAMISEKHANFIVNKGNAKSSDIWKLMKTIQETINSRYNIYLEPEIELIGRFP